MPSYREEARDLPLVHAADVIVCGGGPAGIGTAIAAARTGAKTVILETHGCLGGVWTAGALSCVLEAGKPGILAEITARLGERGARTGDGTKDYLYDLEAMKIVLEEMVQEAGVAVQLHTRVVAATPDTDGRLTTVVTESKSGRQAWSGEVIVDATGDGDVAALAGCGFDVGHPETGQTQPMTLMAVLTGIRLDEVYEFTSAGAEHSDLARQADPATRFRHGTGKLLATLRRAGIDPSYQSPSLASINDGLFSLMANHEYGVPCFDAGAITSATFRARAELNRIVDGLRSLGGIWANLALVSTGAQIGVREGRRIHGLYTVTVDDVLGSARHEDAVCTVRSGADIHALSREEGGFLSRTTAVLHPDEDAATTLPPSREYDIPLRSLIARDVDGLLMAGRCISGDFLAHGSYRMTGNAVMLGQAAGVLAANAAELGCRPQDVPWETVRAGIARIEADVSARAPVTA